jgi:hypothetical protein
MLGGWICQTRFDEFKKTVRCHLLSPGEKKQVTADVPLLRHAAPSSFIPIAFIPIAFLKI